jgi:hypothetical protein
MTMRSAFVLSGCAAADPNISPQHSKAIHLVAVANDDSQWHKSVENSLANSKTIDPLILYTTKELMALPLPVSPRLYPIRTP